MVVNACLVADPHVAVYHAPVPHAHPPAEPHVTADDGTVVDMGSAARVHARLACHARQCGTLRYNDAVHGPRAADGN